MNQGSLYSALASGGLLPFFATALASVLGIAQIPGLGAPAELLNSYGLVIVCFLAGVHWATAIYHEDKALRKLLVVSNAVLLTVWIAYATGPLSISLLAQVIALIVLLAIDFWIKNSGLIAMNYWHVRVVATMLASVSILVVLLR